MSDSCENFTSRFVRCHSDDALSLVAGSPPSERKLLIFETPTSIIAYGTVYRLAGKLEEAEQVAAATLKVVEQHGYRGIHAKVAHLLGNIHASHSPPDTTKAIGYYEQAVSLAKELQMRPLVAQCNRSLGLLHNATEQYEEVSPYLTQAVKLFSDMEMEQWTVRTEQELKGVSDRLN